jgi:hypothetical protein
MKASLVAAVVLGSELLGLITCGRSEPRQPNTAPPGAGTSERTAPADPSPAEASPEGPGAPEEPAGADVGMTDEERSRPATGATDEVSPAAESAALDKELLAIRNAVAGQRFLVTWRDGGPVYGTYFFVDLHIGQSGRYSLSGQSRKQTVLGNEQVSNWEGSGTWRVGRQGGQAGLVYVDEEGQKRFDPVRVQPGGGLFIREGTSVVHKGPAGIR